MAETVSVRRRRATVSRTPWNDSRPRDRPVSDRLPALPAIPSRRVLRGLVGAAALIAIVGWVSGLVRLYPDALSVPHMITRRLVLDGEHTIPSWYSSLLLSASAVLLAITGTIEKGLNRPRPEWKVLAVIFLLLSVDETVAFHETIRPLLEKIGIHAQWMYFGAGFVVALTVYLLPWIRSLERRTRKLFLVSASVYLTGALGAETMSGVIARATGPASVQYLSMTTVEESLELLGVSLFIFALLDNLGSLSCVLRFRVE